MARTEKRKEGGEWVDRVTNPAPQAVNPVAGEDDSARGKKKRRGGMTAVKVAAGALLIPLAMAPSVYGQTRTPPRTPTHVDTTHTRPAPDIEAARKKNINMIQTSELPGSVATDRENCAKGEEVGIVDRARQRGDQSLPPASESCPAVIRRQIHDGTALDLYTTEVTNQGGTASPQQFLASISNAVTNGTTDRVPIGGGKTIALNAPGAFDAGTLIGYMDNTVTPEALGVANSSENVEKLKATADSCLDGSNPKPPSPSACYVSGLLLSALDKRSGPTVAQVTDTTGKSRR